MKTLWPGSGGRRAFALFAAMLYTLLVSVTMSLPHRHADGLPPVSLTAHPHATPHAIAADSLFCPICDWIAAAHHGVSGTATMVVATAVTWQPARVPILVRAFGLVEPGHTPQRGPPAS